MELRLLNLKKRKEKHYLSSKMQPVGNKICWLRIPKGSACFEVLPRESKAVRCCLYLSPLLGMLPDENADVKCLHAAVVVSGKRTFVGQRSVIFLD